MRYPDSMYGSIGISIKSIGAYLNLEQYNSKNPPLLIGMILFTIAPNTDNSYLSFTYFMQKTNSAYIISLGVVKELRGHGIATNLIQKCIQKCEKDKLHPLFLSLHVATYNIEAILLYERLRFKRTKIVKDYYLIDNQYYDSYLYMIYINNASEPALSLKNFIKIIGLLKKVSRLLRKCCKK